MEKAIEEGEMIQELERCQGWTIITSRIKEEVLQCLHELRQIDLDGRSLENIGSEYISRIQKVNGLERVLEIVNEIKEAHEQALNNQ